MIAWKFDVACFDVAEKATQGKDGFDVLGELFDRLLQRVDPVLKAILFFQESVRPLSRANKFMHEKKIVGAGVGFFFGAEKLQPFFKLRHKSIRFLESKNPFFLLSHSSRLLLRAR